MQCTARELRPGDDERAAELAMVVGQVLAEPVPVAPLAGHATMPGP
jgi:hypothetical protein